MFLSFSGCSDDELDEEATQHALWSVTVFEVWTFTDISSQKKIATTCEQTSAEPVMYVQCPDIRACYETENYVGKTFLNLKFCKKLVTLLKATSKT